MPNFNQMLQFPKNLIERLGQKFLQFFIPACLVISAVLVAIISPRVGLSTFGLSFLLTVMTALVVRHVQHHAAYRAWIVTICITILVSILVVSRIGPNIVHLRNIEQRIFGSLITGGEWVGLSYLIFRLIHVLISYRRVGEISVGQMSVYALFPPALIAGPIHRADQFIPQLEQRHFPRSYQETFNALWRIGLGIVKKVLIAGFFSMFALTPTIATNQHATRWMLWVSLIGFSLQIYFDFAGYSDIVIGIAGLVGIKLPENFANPYGQRNISRFWQTWHMSLSFWLRDYIFLPLSRVLLKRFGSRWSTLIMAVSHLTTMIIAGLWHGLTTGFLAWGVWHGTGLFFHAQWHRRASAQGIQLPRVLGIVFTFTFVTLGWVFFVMPNLNSGLTLLMRLFKG